MVPEFSWNTAFPVYHSTPAEGSTAAPCQAAKRADVLDVGINLAEERLITEAMGTTPREGLAGGGVW
jgi:hypothetical protein